jgi:hypothetical protein
MKIKKIIWRKFTHLRETDKGDVSTIVAPLLNSSISILVLRGSCVSFVALNGNVFCIGTEMTIQLFLSK